MEFPRTLALVLAATLGLAACNGDRDHDTPPPTASPPTGLDRLLDEQWPEGAGGTVIAARDGERVTCRAFGMADREAGVATECGTAYDLMSITKQFTAAATLKLQMLGSLRVDDPISTYLGPIPDDKRDITLHHLLTHTAGLTEQLGDDYDELSREDMVAGALASELQSAPGTEFSYSNLGYSLLAAIVEQASGMGYEEFLAEQLFTPAGMTQTGYVLPEWRSDQVAVEYDERGEPQGRPFEHPWDDDGPYWNLRGNGGMLSTAEDMLRWQVALAGEEILDQRAKDLMYEPHVPIGPERDGFYYGYGWGVLPTDDGRIITHSGGNGWSYGVLAIDLDAGVMVFWVSNHAYQDGEWSFEEHGEELTLAMVEHLRTGD